MNAAGSGTIGAILIARSELSASSGRGGEASITAAIVPTRLVIVAPVVRTTSRKPDAVNFVRSASVPPATRMRIAFACAETWNNGLVTSIVSPAVTSQSQSTAARYAWRCVITTPFDGPVVPEVKTTAWTSHGCDAGSGGGEPSTANAPGDTIASSGATRARFAASSGPATAMSVAAVATQ